ncbi:NAD(P)H-dependent oxidoreductase subunit E [Candidatus Dependentiae bacterium]|nr:NAD(P)H-dependent oxidoreductase subunit E [Candidatus Dependentiae bacterium]
MKIKVCLGTCCHLLGNYEIIEVLEKTAKNNINIEFSGATCLNHCRDSELKPPFVEIDGEIIQNVKVEDVLNYIKSRELSQQ